MPAWRLEEAPALLILSDMTHIPLDPEHAVRVRESFSRQGLMRNLGARLAEAEPGAIEIRVPYREDLTQQHGYFHGGVSATIADTACGYAAYRLTASGATVLTVEFKVNMLAPAQSEELIARARVVRACRTLTVCMADAFTRSGGSEIHCATMLATIRCLPGKSARPGQMKPAQKKAEQCSARRPGGIRLKEALYDGYLVAH
jgi:uncharacterized protein (TIGR00369 family)